MSTVRYGDTKDKRAGINNEPIIAQKVVDFFTKKGYIVHLQKSSTSEDQNDKIDYYLIFDESTPYIDGQTTIPFDTKDGFSYTYIDRTGEDHLFHCKSRWLVFNNKKNTDELLFVNVNKLKECREIHPFPKYPSKQPGNNSIYMWMDTYIKQYKYFFGDYAKIVNITE